MDGDLRAAAGLERQQSGAALVAHGVALISTGGTPLGRAAAENHDAVTVVTDPAEYSVVIDDMEAHHGAPRSRCAGADDAAIAP